MGAGSFLIIVMGALNSKVTPKSRFPVERHTGNLLSGLLLSYFPGIPKAFFRGFF